MRRLVADRAMRALRPENKGWHSETLSPDLFSCEKRGPVLSGWARFSLAGSCHTRCADNCARWHPVGPMTTTTEPGAPANCANIGSDLRYWWPASTIDDPPCPGPPTDLGGRCR